MLTDRQMQQILQEVLQTVDHHGEEKKKRNGEKLLSTNEKKFSKICYKIDEYVTDYVCENACVKVPNARSVKKGSPERRGGGGGAATKCPQEHPACNKFFCRSGDVRRGEVEQDPLLAVEPHRPP